LAKQKEDIEAVDDARPLTFTKAQILASKKYQHARSALAAILADGRSYSQQDIDSELDKFMKARVR